MGNDSARGNVGISQISSVSRPSAPSNTAITAQDAINRVFNNIEQNVTGPYQAGYDAAIAASQNQQGITANDVQKIVSDIVSSLNLSDPSNYLQSAVDLANLNTASSEAMAREQMKFQELANAKAMSFSSNEALKTRNWQSMMSDTAHQREVADLIKAGLNPILSANQGAQIGSAANAAGVTSSGAKGTVDTSAVQALTQAYVMARQVEMQGASLQMEQKKIDAQMAMNLLSNETQRYGADRQAQASMYGSQLTSNAHRYAAELDYSTWANGLHNQYAQLGEWIYKALSGINFDNMFNFSNMLGNLIKKETNGQGMRQHSKTEQGNTPSTINKDIHGRTWMYLNQ